MVSDCIRFYKVESSNDCYDIALEAGVALSDFYSWNPAVNSNCSGLQSGEYVCIGISGYATTISTGTPVPVTPTPTQVSHLLYLQVDLLKASYRAEWSQAVFVSTMCRRGIIVLIWPLRRVLLHRKIQPFLLVIMICFRSLTDGKQGFL